MAARKKAVIPDTLPNSEESEKAVLALILTNDEARAKAIEKLLDEDFYHPVTLLIFAQMGLLFQAGKPFDTISFTQHLRDMNLFEQCNLVYIEICTMLVPPSMLEHYISILKDKTLLRHGACCFVQASNRKSAHCAIRD